MRIFVSYRRADSAGVAGRIADKILGMFGDSTIFMDVEAIPYGVDFERVIQNEVNNCDVMLVLIGPAWLDARDELGNPRLFNPKDYVRLEVGTALALGKRVIPLLIDGASMPSTEQLPETMHALSLFNGIAVRHAYFHHDLAVLTRALHSKDLNATLTPTREVEAQLAASGRVHVDAPFVHGAPHAWFLPGSGKTEWFQDYENGPEMVVVPAGSFIMGSDHRTKYWNGPAHNVKFANPIAISRHAITFGQWDQAVRAGGCDGYSPSDRGWGRGARPVIMVSWADAKRYADWLSKQTGKPYRLPSEAEWEYAARAGTTTNFWWGDSITPASANYDTGGLFWTGGLRRTVAVQSYSANPWGLFQVHGNVSEWCEDVYQEDYGGAPTDGSARLRGAPSDRRVMRGGGWASPPVRLLTFQRSYDHETQGNVEYGFRLVRALER